MVIWIPKDCKPPNYDQANHLVTIPPGFQPGGMGDGILIKSQPGGFPD